MVKILRFLLCLKKTVIEGVELDGDRIVVAVRPYKAEMHRCPECGRRCPVYDRAGTPRSWRTLDLGTAMCFLEYGMVRVECPEHGVLACRVPWARRGSWFTREFEDQVAWLMTHCNRTVVAHVSVNIVFTNFVKILSPYPTTLFHQTRQRTFTTSG